MISTWLAVVVSFHTFICLSWSLFAFVFHCSWNSPSLVILSDLRVNIYRKIRWFSSSGWKGRKKNIKHLCKINYSDLVGGAQQNYVQTQDTVSFTACICTLFECVCSGEVHVHCHRSGNGLGTASPREGYQWGRVQCLVYGDCIRFFLWVHSQEQDLPVQVSVLHKHLES